MREAVVIGGGPAGAALAAVLARAGRDVLLLEREADPVHKVCGEFVSEEACRYLARLGVDLGALGAERIDRVRLWGPGGGAEARLPFEAFSLSRQALDEALLGRAAASGACVSRGRRAVALDGGEGDWRVRLAEGGEVRGRDVFLAVGKHDMKGWRRPEGPQGDLVGFKLHWRLEPEQRRACAGASELFLFPGGYAGLEPIEGGRANLCLLVRRGRLKALGGDWPALLSFILSKAPVLAERLDGATPLWPKPLAVAGLPYGHLHRGGGPWRLGDQAAVIPSFAGDGLAIALHSAEAAARAWLAGETAKDYHARLAGDLRPQVARALWLSRAMVRPAGQGLLSFAAARAPGLMSRIAAGTRIPAWRLVEASSRPPPFAAPPALRSPSAPG
jgi:flavin-dependent dehydrogenase